VKTPLGCTEHRLSCAQDDERQRIIKDSVPLRSGAAAFSVQEEFFANAGFYSLARSEPNKILKKVCHNPMWTVM